MNIPYVKIITGSPHQDATRRTQNREPIPYKTVNATNGIKLRHRKRLSFGFPKAKKIYRMQTNIVTELVTAPLAQIPRIFQRRAFIWVNS